MIHINKSPIAPASANRVYKSLSRDEHTKQNFAMPPHHVSYYLENVLNALSLKAQHRQNIKQKICTEEQ